MDPEGTPARDAPVEVETPLAALRRTLPGLLEPGETVREVTHVTCAFGDTGDPDAEEPAKPTSPAWFDRAWSFATRTTLRKVLFLIPLSPILLYVMLDSIGGGGRWLDRLVGGQTCEGQRGSLARLAQHALSALGPSADVLAVTDRRMVLLKSGGGGSAVRELVWTTPLVNVVEATHRPRGLSRRRVEVRFADGSWIMLALPLFESPKPAAVAAALHAAYLPPD